MSSSDRLLAPVPKATFQQPGMSGSRKWTADFNVACWLRALGGQAAELKLLLRYRDADGDREVTVDRLRVTGTDGVLLAGRIAAPATGSIEEMTVWLQADPAGQFAVDELYVQRLGLTAAAGGSLSAAR